MFVERSGIIVWLHDPKAARNLERYGMIHYISKKMNYVVIYVNSNRVDENMKVIQNLPYVKKVERSYRDEIPTEYSNKNTEKMKN
jgi:uncharacterized protein YlbG (UPF0298 family)